MPYYPPASSGGTVTDATIATSDITTNNFSTTKHGWCPKGTNIGNFLKDDGTFAAPTATASVPWADMRMLDKNNMSFVNF